MKSFSIFRQHNDLSKVLNTFEKMMENRALAPIMEQMLDFP